MKVILRVTIMVFLCKVAIAQHHERKIYHFSSMDAMRNGVYNGNISVNDITKKGDFGLGTFHLLDGEMIILDGTVYRVRPEGLVEKAAKEMTIPFGSVTFFQKPDSIILKNIKSFEELQTILLQKLPTRNRFYAIKITSEFTGIVVGGAIKVKESDTTGIADLMKTRPVYTRQKIKGTIIGFYNPAFVGGLDLFPFHFHFLSTDKTFGGHLIKSDFLSTEITVLLNEKNAYEVILPHKQHDVYQREWKNSGLKSSY